MITSDTLSPLDHRALTDALLAPVFEAGALVLRHSRTGVAVERKADASPVTAADREAEAILVAALARIAPAVPVLAEEAISAGHEPPAAATFFAVDPLDGTRDFVAGKPDFTINVGLVVEGRPVFGIVLVPARGEIYATLGVGQAGTAFVDPSLPVPQRPAPDWRPIAVRRWPVGGPVVVVSPWRPTADVDRWLGPYGVAERRLAGSSYKFCLLARGDADIYPQPGPTHEWDTAAGQAVLEAAGGTVLTRDGRPLAYGKRQQQFLNPPYIAWGTPPGR
jgi:3'(2'), 5'-bisphosphate nucleotidase